jgi:hypothetical protein
MAALWNSTDEAPTTEIGRSRPVPRSVRQLAALDSLRPSLPIRPSCVRTAPLRTARQRRMISRTDVDMERVKGIEPSSLGWEPRALPLSYTRPVLGEPQRRRRMGMIHPAPGPDNYKLSSHRPQPPASCKSAAALTAAIHAVMNSGWIPRSVAVPPGRSSR